MKDFELKLGGTLYTCTSNHQDKDSRNRIVRANIGNFRITIDIPIEEKVSDASMMAFICSFHDAMREAKKVNKIDINDLSF